MGILSDYAKKWMNWQKDQAEADTINAETAKKKARIAATKKRLAFMNDPRNDVQKTRQQALRGSSLTPDELKSVGFGSDDAAGGN